MSTMSSTMHKSTQAQNV